MSVGRAAAMGVYLGLAALFLLGTPAVALLLWWACGGRCV